MFENADRRVKVELIPLILNGMKIAVYTMP
jgi:hypothetical protein